MSTSLSERQAHNIAVLAGCGRTDLALVTVAGHEKHGVIRVSRYAEQSIVEFLRAFCAIVRRHFHWILGYRLKVAESSYASVNEAETRYSYGDGPPAHSSSHEGST